MTMKTTLKIALMAAIVATSASCTKVSGEQTPLTGNRSISAVFSSADACSKVSLNQDYSQSWQAGDQLSLYQPSTGAFGTLTTSDAGSSATFSGDLADESADLDPNAPCYFFTPAACVNKRENGILTLNVSREQSGYIDDFGKFYISYSEGIVPQSSGDGYKFESESAMKNLLPIVKFNIEPGTGIKRIDVMGSNNGSTRHNAGLFQYNPATGEVIAWNDPDKVDARIRRYNTDKELIEISGDVYIILKPVAGGYDGLQFTFKSDNEGTQQKKFVKDFSAGALVAGQIRNLGTIPSTFEFDHDQEFPATAVSVKEGNISGKATILISNSVAGTNFYYTMDGSEPTTSSTVYTSAGIDVTETCYLRILATKAGYVNQVTNAYVRFYHYPKGQTATTTEIAAGGTYTIGFATLYNTASTAMTLKLNGDNFTPGTTTDYKISAQTMYGGKGCWAMRFYYNNNQSSARTRGVTANYDGTAHTKNKSYAAGNKNYDWLCTESFAIEPGKEIYGALTHALSIYGFVWVEYGFDWSSYISTSLTNEKMGE